MPAESHRGGNRSSSHAAELSAHVIDLKITAASKTNAIIPPNSLLDVQIYIFLRRALARIVGPLSVFVSSSVHKAAVWLQGLHRAERTSLYAESGPDVPASLSSDGRVRQRWD